MPSIGLIAEGHTDQVVIEQVLLGLFEDQEEEPDIRFVQPLAHAPDANGSYAPGGWTVLFDYLRRGGHREALQFNDVLVIHVDTDVCEEAGFDVLRRDAQGPLAPEHLAEAVEARLVDLIGPDLFGEVRGRIIFAVAVDEVECWLLPLLFPDQKAKRSKTTGCLEAADHKLRQEGRPRLRSGDSKDPAGYKAISRLFAKKKTIGKHRAHNPSLGRFVEAVELWQGSQGTPP